MRDQVDKVCKVGRRGGDMSWRGILSNVSLERQERKQVFGLFNSLRSAMGIPPIT